MKIISLVSKIIRLVLSVRLQQFMASTKKLQRYLIFLVYKQYVGEVRDFHYAEGIMTNR
jgi:hypothetical protein